MSPVSHTGPTRSAGARRPAPRRAPPRTASAQATIGGGPAQGSKPKAALEILKERFARGEIDQDEFDDRRRALQG